MGGSLKIDLEKQAEILNVISLFGLPRFSRILLQNVKDISTHLAAFARIFSLAINSSKPIGVGISGDATDLKVNKGHTRIRSIVFDTDEQFISILEMCQASKSLFFESCTFNNKFEVKLPQLRAWSIAHLTFIKSEISQDQSSNLVENYLMNESVTSSLKTVELPILS